jgi:hypothetical protein
MKRITNGMGPAFIKSGSALDNMRGRLKMSISVATKANYLCEWLPVVFHLCDILIGKWTNRQAEIVRIALAPDNLTVTRIAKQLNQPSNLQAVSGSLRRASWEALRSVLKQFELMDWKEICCKDNT